MDIIAMKTMVGAYWDKEKTRAINTKAVLKWVLSDENIYTTVPGITSFDQLQQNLDLMADIRLTEGEESDLELTKSNNINGVYCQQGGKCVLQCIESLYMPAAMRIYVCIYGYKNLANAKQTFEFIGNKFKGVFELFYL